MAKKTNKTSHVMNLITNGAPVESEGEQEAVKEEGGQEKEAPVKVVSAGEKRVIVVDESSQNKKVENQILENLTSYLDEEEGKAGQTEQAGAADQTEQIRGAEPSEQVEPSEQAEPVVQAKEMEQAGQVEQAIQTEEARQVEQAGQTRQAEPVEQEKEYQILNVMEEILKRKNLDKFMEEYEVCMCSRCRADVFALALTGLPAKYIVAEEGATGPLVGYYENKFKAKVLAEIIKSCMAVRDNPRHDL